MMSTGRPTKADTTGFKSAVMLRVLFCGAMLALAGVSAAVAQESGNSLQDIQVHALPGNKIELRLMLSGPAPEPLSFTIDSPARIALDLQGTSLGLKSRRKDVGIGVLDTILAAEANGRTRVVLNLDTMVSYQMRVSGNDVYVTLGGESSGPAAVTSFDSVQSTPEPSGTMASSRGIEAVDFRRSSSGGGRVIISMSDAGIPVDVRQESGNIIVNFIGADLPDALLQRLDVMDFATPVKTIDVVRVGNDTRLIIAATTPFEELAYQSGTVFTVEVQPVIEEEQEVQASMYDADREYSGERLTLNFQDIETRAVLQLLADVSGRNIVVADTVSGNVTLRLQNVPWDQALDIVLATKGLDMRENGNVIIVAPREEIAAREKADLESRKEISQLEPLTSEFLQVNYAKAADLAGLIQQAGANFMLSERGSVGVDERTNTLLLQDTAERIATIRRLVTTLDIPVRQVLIQARIVVVSDTFTRELGTRWGVTAVDDRSGNGLVSVTGSAEGNDTIIQSGLENLNNTGTPFPVTVPTLNDRFGINLPIANPAGQLAVAILDDDFLVDLELSAMQAEGNGEVISSPRLITANQKQATIKSGVEIPYQQSSSSGATTVQFKEAVLSLTVTPQITPDDRIIMDLLVSRDTIGSVVSDSLGGSIPSIDTRSVETQVLVNNGQTVVLGGIYETELIEDETKVPYLGDIPYLGFLFKSTRVRSNRTELLIFVTPKIIKEGSIIN